MERSIRGAAFPVCFGIALQLVCFVALAFPKAAFSQTPESQTPVWKSDLKESDLDVEALRQILLGKEKAVPASLRLRYSRAWLNYAVFYDLRGREICFRYRDHRFDERAKKKLRGLIPGQAYEVFGVLEGLVVNGIFYKKDTEDFWKYLQTKKPVLVFRFDKARPLRVEQIIF